VDSEGRARGECFGETKVVVREARIGAVLVEGGNDTDGSLVRHERDEERRDGTDPAGNDLIDLGICQDRVDAFALSANEDSCVLRVRLKVGAD
jgi:hypothetical protein